MSGAGKTVCVTGASGYIASWLVKLLLAKGYTVKASVRDPNDRKKTEHLLALDGAKERLHLFKANLLEEGSFDSLVDGCEGVFHTASPVTYTVIDPQAELIDPALKGTLNVLGSCAKATSVKRVVVTSSVAAVAYNGKPRTPDVVVDETWFSDPEFCKDIKKWYALSKTLAEDAAWKFAKEKGMDMITINPSVVIGPLLQTTLNLSAEIILNLTNGAQTFPNATYGWVNVNDVANAHIQAFEIPSANGRYVLVSRVAHYSQIVKTLHELYPTLNLPEKCSDDKPYVPTYQVSQEKARALGINFIPLEVNRDVMAVKERLKKPSVAEKSDAEFIDEESNGIEKKLVAKSLCDDKTNGVKKASNATEDVREDLQACGVERKPKWSCKLRKADNDGDCVFKENVELRNRGRKARENHGNT
ncbi:hypothetical protein NE237_005149 [Protea cynaroides]|uniref:NAD-dependent epimerase/dehydratase domain-containing protein n=1 Tax=Protea cynaroides TaxID=273540 RepID=A0A9Q0KKC0_9MAGN|nr:hypothetical protein NE237_005149 [Protea cynaroides]